MSDFNSSLPVRTENAGDVIAKIADATTPSQQLAVDSSGRVTSKLNDGAGNSVTSQASGGQRALDVGIDVAGVQIDPRQIRALTSADVVTVDQGTSPWVDNLTQVGGSAISLGQKTSANSFPVVLASDQSAIPVSQSGSWTVSATQGTSPWVSKDQADGSVNGGTAGSFSLLAGAIYNSTPLTLTNGQQASLQSDVNGYLNVDLKTALPAGSNLIGAVNLDLGGSPVSNTNPVPVAIVSATTGNAINDFKDATSIAANASDNHDYTVTAGKTLTLHQIESSGSGKAKMQIQVETGVATNVFTTYFVQFNSTSETNMSVILQDPVSVAAGVRVRVIMSNLDKAAQDLYSTICGQEN